MVSGTTIRKKLRQKCQDMNAWLKAVRNTARAEDRWPILVADLRGYYQYYGISGNMPALRRYHSTALRLTRRWLNRRSQRGKYNWRRLPDYLKHYPLSGPRIVHNLYTLAPVR